MSWRDYPGPTALLFAGWSEINTSRQPGKIRIGVFPLFEDRPHESGTDENTGRQAAGRSWFFLHFAFVSPSSVLHLYCLQCVHTEYAEIYY